jgi:hypothetical protein
MQIFCSFVTDLAAVKARMAVTYEGNNKTAPKPIKANQGRA